MQMNRVKSILDKEGNTMTVAEWVKNRVRNYRTNMQGLMKSKTRPYGLTKRQIDDMVSGYESALSELAIDGTLSKAVLT